MTTHMVRLSDLQAMGESERQNELAELVKSAKAAPNGQGAAVLESRIRAFELQHEMSSSELLEGLGRGEVRETANIASWLFWLSVRDDIEARA